MTEGNDSEKAKALQSLVRVLNAVKKPKEHMENSVLLLKVFEEIFKSRIEESEFVSSEIGEKDEELKSILDSIRKSSEDKLKQVIQGISDIGKRIDDLNRIGEEVAVLIDKINDIKPATKRELLLKLEEIQERLDKEFAELSENRDYEKIDDERIRKKREEERERKLQQLEKRRVGIERAIASTKRKEKPDEEAVRKIEKLREELKKLLWELAAKLGEDSSLIAQLVSGLYNSAVDLAERRFEVYKEIIRKCLLDGKAIKDLWGAYDELLLPLVEDNYKLAKEQTEFLNILIENAAKDGKSKFEAKDIMPEFDIDALLEKIEGMDKNFDSVLFEKVLCMGYQLLSAFGISLNKEDLKKDIETLKGISVPDILNLNMQKRNKDNGIKNLKQILKKIAKAWQNDIGQFYTTEENLGRISLILESAYKKNMEELLILRSNITHGHARVGERDKTAGCLSMIDETNRKIAEHMKALSLVFQHEKKVLELAEELQNSSGEETKNLFENLIAKRREYEERISKIIKNQLMRKGGEEAIIIRRIQIYECLLCSHLVQTRKLSEIYKEYSPYFVLSEKNRKKLNKELANLLNKKLEECKCDLVKLEVPKIPPKLEERESRENEGREKAEKDEEKAGPEGTPHGEKEIEEEVNKTEKEAAQADNESERTKPFSKFDSELERLKNNSEKLKEEFNGEIKKGINNIKVSVLERYIVKANNNISMLIVLVKEVSRETNDNITEEHYRRIAEINSDLCYVVAESLRRVALLEDAKSIKEIVGYSTTTLGLVQRIMDVFNEAGKRVPSELNTEFNTIDNLIGQCNKRISKLNKTHSAEGGKIDETLWNAFLGIKHGSMLVKVLKVPKSFSRGKKRISEISKESEELRSRIEEYLTSILENLKKYAEGHAIPDERTDEVRIMETAASLTLKERGRTAKPDSDILEIIGEIFKLRADEFGKLKEELSGIIERESGQIAVQMSYLLKDVSSYELLSRRWQANVLQFRERISEVEERIRNLCGRSENIKEALIRASDESKFEKLNKQREEIISSVANYCKWYEKAVRNYTAYYESALESQAEKRIKAYAEILSYHEVFRHPESVNALARRWTAYSQFLHPIGEINWIIAFKSGEKLKESVRKMTDGMAAFGLGGFHIPLDFRERAEKLLNDPQISKDKSFEIFEEWLRKRKK